MRLSALIRKEALLLLRDWHALAVLFIMPSLFMLLIAFAMANVNLNRLPALTVVLDIPAPSAQSEFFRAALAAQLPGGELLEPGAAPAGPQPLSIHVPTNFADLLLGESKADMLSLAFDAQTDLLTRQRLRAAALTALGQTRLHAYLLDSGELDPGLPLEERLALIQKRTENHIQEQEVLASGDYGKQANASQHNVPAWLIFGMFFVMLPMASSFQREQQSGTLLRFQCLRLNHATLALSKLLPYFAINLVQFALLLNLGRLLPHLGLAPLTLSGSFASYLLLAVSLALAACSLGLLIASLARSSEQALMLSGGLNIILAAIGGIMVPKSLMPDGMRLLAEVSPMSWALDAFLTLLVGQGQITDIAPYCARLLVFAACCVLLGLFLFRRRLSEIQWTTHF